MGAKLTAFENRSRTVDMEIRVLLPSARPDQYLCFTRIEPGRVKELKTRSLRYECSNDPGNPPVLIMVVMGTKFIFLDPQDAVVYAKITCDIDEVGLPSVRYFKTRFLPFRRIRGFGNCIGRD